MANNTVCRSRQTAFLPRLKPGVSCLFLMTVEQWTAKRRSETVSRQQQAAIEDAIQDLQERWRSHAGQFAWQREELVQPS